MEFSEFVSKDGRKMDPDLARFGAFMVGAANAGLDVVSFKAFSKLLFGNNKILNLLSKTGKSMKIPKDPGVIKRLILDFAGAVSTEVVTESAQEGVKFGGGELLKLVSEEDFESRTVDELVTNMAAAGDEALKVAIPLFGISATGRIGIEKLAEKATANDRVRAEERVQKLESAVSQVAAEGVIQDTSPEIVSLVARKMVNGEELTTSEIDIGENILAEAKARLAQEEGKPIEFIQHAASTRQFLK